MTDQEAILQLLSDGQWVNSAEIAEKVSHVIPPERALRLKSVWEHKTQRFDLEQRVRKARRRAVMNRLRWMRVAGKLEAAVIDGHRMYRLVT